MVTGFLWRRRWDSNPRGAHHAKTISSRSRYDHFDTSPYMSARRFSCLFRWKRALERTDGKNSKLFSFSNRVKPAWLQGFWWTKRTASRKISSAAPSTTRTTLRVYFRPVFFPEICSKIRWREKQERRQKIFDFEIFCVEEYQGESGGRNSQLLPKFRVISPVMTTSIRFRIYPKNCCRFNSATIWDNKSIIQDYQVKCKNFLKFVIGADSVFCNTAYNFCSFQMKRICSIGF